MASSGPITKRTFEYRMSKKVAELTQVVHMLFMKNHEKDLEMEALKDAYEHEIDLVIADAKTQLRELSRQLQEMEQLQQQRKEQRTQDEEDQKRIQSLEKLLKSERLECQNIRDLLVQSQKDLETLRALNEDEKLKHDNETQDKDRELNKLRVRINDLERHDKVKDSHAFRQSESLRDLVEKLQKETSLLREDLTNSKNDRAAMLDRHRNLEEDIKKLKRELERRSSDLQNRPTGDRIIKQQQATLGSGIILRKSNYEREIQQLKQEIQRYRMELSNREMNFNRRFADMQPIVLTHGRRSQLRPISSALVKTSETPGDNHGHSSVVQTNRYTEGSLLSSSVVSPSSINSIFASTADQELDFSKLQHTRRPQLEKPQPSKCLAEKKSH